jgi:hypothetical protein
MLTDGQGANAARGHRQAERYEGLCRPATRLGGRAHLSPGSDETGVSAKDFENRAETFDIFVILASIQLDLRRPVGRSRGLSKHSLLQARPAVGSVSGPWPERGNDGDAPTAALGTSPAQVTAGDPFPDLRPDAEAPATPGLSQNRLCDCVLVGDYLVAR